MAKTDPITIRFEEPEMAGIKELSDRNALDQISEEILTGKTLDFLASNVSVQTNS